MTSLTSNCSSLGPVNILPHMYLSLRLIVQSLASNCYMLKLLQPNIKTKTFPIL
jgi:hypothetical protein